MAQDAMAALRHALSLLEQGSVRSAPELFPLGAESIDESLGGGLARGALHEVYAAKGVADAASVAGFGLGVAMRAAGQERSLLWVRQAYSDTEAGWLYGAGLSAFGIDPARVVLVRARDPTSVLRAAAEGARCAALGAVIVEMWGEPAVLDLRASRRLALSAQRSGLALLMIRLGAEPAPSAATTRWLVSARASRALEANAPGRPAFHLRLLRHRAGIADRQWLLEWDRDQLSFSDPAPLSRAVVPVPYRQPAAADAGAGETVWRRAG